MPKIPLDVYKRQLLPATALAAALATIARLTLAAIFVFYAIEHFLFPHNVPGVPLEKMTPAWMLSLIHISPCHRGVTSLRRRPTIFSHRAVHP